MTTKIFGIHAVMALLEQDASAVDVLYLLEKRKDKKFQQLLSKAGECKVPVERVKRAELDRMCAHNHQGVVASTKRAVTQQQDLMHLITTAQQPLRLLVLDQITDPHNLGACLRSAAAFAVDAVIVPKDHSAAMSPVVEKVSCGASQTVPFYPVSNLARTLSALKEHGVWLYGLDGGSSESVRSLDATQSVALIMGSEGQGMRRLTKEQCDFIVHIPMLGNMESLNVSVATGIALYELTRD